MLTDVGEYLVGAYLQLIEECDFVDYNIRPPGGGLKGLEELDVLGLNFKENTAYLCEVTTHIRGLIYKDNVESVKRIKKKYARQKLYAKESLTNFKNKRFMFWSPRVPVGYITEHLSEIKGLELIINGEYKRRITELMDHARKTTYDARNPVYRVLQIIGHMRD
jgi:hypothetical protein